MSDARYKVPREVHQESPGKLGDRIACPCNNAMAMDSDSAAGDKRQESLGTLRAGHYAPSGNKESGPITVSGNYEGGS